MQGQSRQDDARANDRTHTPTLRLTVPDAAAALGISAEAIRSRIKRKTLPIEKDSEGTVFVLLDNDRTRQDGDRANDRANDRAGDSTATDALLEAKDRTIAALQQQLDRAEERDRENRRLLAAALERIPAIEAPPEGPESPQTASESTDKGTGTADHTEAQNAAQPQSDTNRRSWWQRLFDG
jgi:hypothetical protein